MTRWDSEFRLILKHTIKIGRHSGNTTTAMGDSRPTGESVVVAAASVYFDYYADSNRKGGSLKRREFGEFRNLEARAHMPYDTDITEGDTVYPVVGPVGFTMLHVVYVRPIMDFDGNTHHIEVGMEKMN